MLTLEDLVACIIVGTIMLLLIVLSIVLMMGKGSWLIAGYNTLTSEEKAKYDRVALCRFMGKYLLSISAVMPLLPIGGIFEMYWMIAVYIIYVLVSLIFAVVYCNTGNRFKKAD